MPDKVKGVTNVYAHGSSEKGYPYCRGTNYEILVYQVEETEEYNIYVAKGGFGVGNVFTASQEMVRAIASDSGGDVVEELN